MARVRLNFSGTTDVFTVHLAVGAFVLDSLRVQWTYTPGAPGQFLPIAVVKAVAEGADLAVRRDLWNQPIPLGGFVEIDLPAGLNQVPVTVAVGSTGDVTLSPATTNQTYRTNSGSTATHTLSF